MADVLVVAEDEEGNSQSWTTERPEPEAAERLRYDDASAPWRPSRWAISLSLKQRRGVRLEATNTFNEL